MSPVQRVNLKYDRETGNIKEKEKTRSELFVELKRKGFKVKGKYIKEQLQTFANEYNIPLVKQEREMTQGWCNKDKGLVQVLYECG